MGWGGVTADILSNLELVNAMTCKIYWLRKALHSKHQTSMSIYNKATCNIPTLSTLDLVSGILSQQYSVLN